LQIHPEQHRVRLHEKQLVDVDDDLCCFIMHEVVNMRGKFFHEAQDLATEDKYIGLHEWDNQRHRAASSSVPREEQRKNMYSMCTLMMYSNDV
jgi:NhaP-type Na+/H+ and K+/H+ antiporter